MRGRTSLRFWLYEDDEVRVPDWVVDLESFRRWTDDDSFPERGHVSYLKGEVWVDMSKEQLFTHNGVKTEYTIVLGGIARTERRGRYFTDGAFLTSVEADVSNQPDGCYVSFESIAEGRVRVVEGVTAGHVELEGAADMVLEVVSASSVEKDTVILRRAYAEAGVREYWLVDARQSPPRFDILRRSKKGLTAVRKQAGWLYSDVFARWFRLTQAAGEDGFPSFTLQVSEKKPAK